jgi:hypothetical protein
VRGALTSDDDASNPQASGFRLSSPFSYRNCLPFSRPLRRLSSIASRKDDSKHSGSPGQSAISPLSPLSLSPLAVTTLRPAYARLHVFSYRLLLLFDSSPTTCTRSRSRSCLFFLISPFVTFGPFRLFPFLLVTCRPGRDVRGYTHVYNLTPWLGPESLLQ